MSQHLNHYGCDVCGDENHDDDYTASHCEECCCSFCPECGFAGTDSMGGDVSICSPCSEKASEEALEAERAFYKSQEAWHPWDEDDEDIPF